MANERYPNGIKLWCLYNENENGFHCYNEVGEESKMMGSERNNNLYDTIDIFGTRFTEITPKTKTAYIGADNAYCYDFFDETGLFNLQCYDDKNRAERNFKSTLDAFGNVVKYY